MLPVHPAVEMFPLMSPDELKDLGADIKQKGLSQPVSLWRTETGYSLLDGRNRLDAMEMVGIKVVLDANEDFVGKKIRKQCVQATFIMPPSDPYGWVASQNIHRRNLTPEKKRDLIVRFAHRTKSDRAIAECMKVDKNVISRTRKKAIVTGALAPVERRTGKDGNTRKYLTTKPPTTSSAAATKIEATTTAERPETQVPALQQIAENSSGQTACLRARIEELENKRRRLELENVELKSEIEELSCSLCKRYIQRLQQLPKPDRIDEVRKLIAEVHICEREMPDIPEFLLRRAGSMTDTINPGAPVKTGA